MPCVIQGIFCVISLIIPFFILISTVSFETVLYKSILLHFLKTRSSARSYGTLYNGLENTRIHALIDPISPIEMLIDTAIF